jgi:hypothetical protein
MRLTLLAGSALAVLTGCATIMQGSGSQGIGFASTPTSAKVTVDNQERGTTPTVVSLSRKDTHLVRIELSGYQPYETTLTRSVSGWVWGNLVFGGIPGLAVDAISGGLYKLSPEQVNGMLVTKTAQAGSDDFMVTVVLHREPSWEKVGQLVRK